MSAVTLDLTVLRMLRGRERFDRFKRMIPEGTVNAATKSLLKNYELFFEGTDAKRITWENFWPFLRTRYPKWKEADVEYWSALTKPIDIDNPPGLDDQIITNLLTTDLANKTLAYIEQWQQGEEVELHEAMRQAVERFDEHVTRKVKSPNVEMSWEDMVKQDEEETGIRWRLKALNDSTRPLRPGDFGIIAMRPDRGKTTLVASEISFMASQVAAMYPDPDNFRPILWLNNEGPGNRILGRIRQSALGLSISELAALGHIAARQRYIETVGGREDIIQVKDIHGFKSHEVEELIRKTNPAIVVFDMIDNIQFSGGAANNGERTDQLLEAMYQWGRTLCVKYDMIGFATSQISGDGEGLKFPTQNQLKDSKTGKQGACDFIITGGVENTAPDYRYIGFTKNKIKREGAKASPNAKTLFDADRGRLIEPQEVNE